MDTINEYDYEAAEEYEHYMDNQQDELYDEMRAEEVEHER